MVLNQNKIWTGSKYSHWKMPITTSSGTKVKLVTGSRGENARHCKEKNNNVDLAT
jgi:hypothetical protein